MPDQSQSAPTRIQRVKRTVACTFCRLRKVRCDGRKPCSNCVSHGEECIIRTRRYIHATDSPGSVASDPVAERLSRLEALLLAAANRKTLSPSRDDTVLEPVMINSLCPDASPSSRFPRDDDRTDSPPQRPAFARPTVDLPESRELQATPQPHPGSLTREGPPSSSHLESSFSKGGTGNENEEIQGDVSVCSVDMSNLEYAGPRTTMAICSEAGLSWITAKLKNPCFRAHAREFMQEIVHRIKLPQGLSSRRSLEPERELAFRYVAAYYQESQVALFDIVPQSWLKPRLCAHFDRPGGDEMDPCWYALRNIIYAHGARIYLRGKATFQAICQTSWGLFENALSTQLDITYSRTSLVGVQALVLMAWFTEGLGSSAIQYMICSNAIRLACSIGLQKQPASSWSFSPLETCRRNWTFWSIYCSEKKMLSRSGRGTSMDDDEITCQIPSVSPSGSTKHVWYCTLLTHFAQLSSRIYKRLSSARALRQTPEELAQGVAELDLELQALAHSVEAVIRLDGPFDEFQPSSLLSHTQALTIQYTYYVLVFQIHTPLTYPWFNNGAQLKDHAAFGDLLQSSSRKVAEASRAALLAASCIQVHADCSIQMAFTGPMYACNNLFIRILENPWLESAESDVALLDVGAGHFARVEFITQSKYRTPIVKEMARLARERVEAARITALDPVHQSSERPDEVAPILGWPLATGFNHDHHEESATDDLTMDRDANDQIDMELWSTLFTFESLERGQPSFAP